MSVERSAWLDIISNELFVCYLKSIETAVHEGDTSTAHKLAVHMQENLVLHTGVHLHFGPEQVGDVVPYRHDFHKVMKFSGGCLKDGDLVTICFPSVCDTQGETLLQPYVCKPSSKPHTLKNR